PYVSGLGNAYPAITVGPVNGITLSRVAGTYAPGGDNVVYNLSGTYTGITNALLTFTLPESDCSVDFSLATFVPASLTCTGTLTYTFSLGGQTCNFNVTYTSSATFNCSNVVNALPASYVNGNSYTGTVTVPYTSGNGTAYPPVALGPVNGLSLSRTPGTFAVG